MNENKPDDLGADDHRTSELRIPLTAAERAELDRAAGGELTATWARLALLIAARR